MFNCDFATIMSLKIKPLSLKGKSARKLPEKYRIERTQVNEIIKKNHKKCELAIKIVQILTEYKLDFTNNLIFYVHKYKQFVES